MFTFWQTCWYFNTFSNESQQKTTKKAPFLVILLAPHELGARRCVPPQVANLRNLEPGKLVRGAQPNGSKESHLVLIPLPDVSRLYAKMYQTTKSPSKQKIPLISETCAQGIRGCNIFCANSCQPRQIGVAGISPVKFVANKTKSAKSIGIEVTAESMRRLRNWPVIIGRISFKIYSPPHKIRITG
jgi:hypothetical protein